MPWPLRRMGGASSRPLRTALYGCGTSWAEWNEPVCAVISGRRRELSSSATAGGPPRHPSTGRCGGWDLLRGLEILCLDGHQAEVERVAISPDDTRLVSKSVDQEIRVWDTGNGVCLTTILGSGDIAAIAAGPKKFSWRAVSRGLETVIESAEGQEVAWFPDMLYSTITHPCGRIWVARAGSHVSIITIEPRFVMVPRWLRGRSETHARSGATPTSASGGAMGLPNRRKVSSISSAVSRVPERGASMMV